jgi:excisionase family DNA binding protein
MEGMSELLTVPEVAAHLRVSERTVRKRIGSGALGAVKLGPEQHAPVRIPMEALAMFLRPAIERRTLEQLS